jgi:hypothetical protein
VTRNFSLIAALMLPAFFGCSKGNPDAVPVQGTVTWKAEHLARAVVTFVPIGETSGGGGSGVTDDEGKFKIVARDGGGLLPGNYKVIISKRLLPDGGVETEPVGAEDSQARESLPEKYSHPEHTQLQATVSRDNLSFRFDLVP